MRPPPSFHVWLFGLAGPLIWLAHFLALYGAASIAERWTGGSGLAVRLLIALATLGALAADGVVIRRALRGDLPFLTADADPEAVRFWRALGGIGAGISLLAVAWQALPALLVR